MRLFSHWRTALAVVTMMVLMGSVSPAFAAGPIVAGASAVAQASTGSATFTGSVKDGSGANVVGAHVTVSGPASASTTTDANGSFTVSVPPGIYTIRLERGGYNSASLENITAVAGSNTPVNVTMAQAQLSSIRTIGQVTTTTRSSQISTSPASQTYIPAQAFSDLPNPSINTVIEHSPDVTLQHMGSQPDTTIVVGAAQPYETQVLIDGHPIALGQLGAWLSQYYPSYMVGGFETQVGPGNTTPFANLAVGGTANLTTPAFTKATHASLTVGGDNYSSQYSNLLATGSFGNLDYVLVLGTAGQNSPISGTTQNLVATDGAGNAIIVNRIPGDGNFYNKGELFKLKYDFTPTISLEAGFNGTYGGYNPQGSAWATYYGQQHIVQCLGPSLATATQCTNPAFSGLIGQNVTSYSWYQGSSVYTTQQMFDATLRVGIGNTTVLVRPYIADIAPENISQTPGAGQTAFANWYGAPGSGLFPNGTPITGVNYDNNGNLTSLTGNVNGVSTTVPANASAQTCAGQYGNLYNQNNQYVTAGQNQAGCFGSAYVTYEQDKLYGATTSILQPIGDSLLDFTYDFHGQSTVAYVNTPSAFTVPPGSADRYSTFSLTGDLHFIKSLAIGFGLYDTTWTVSGSNGPGVPLQNSITKFDPKISFVYHPDSHLAIRAATGGAATFPFLLQVSGLPAIAPPAVSLGLPFGGGGTIQEKNPNLQPETSWAYSLGGDYKFDNGSLLSLDLNQTIVHGVFEQATFFNAYNSPPGCTFQGLPCVQGVFEPFNAALQNAKTITLKYTIAPTVGFGFNIAAAANSTIVTGIPPTYYSPGTASLPADGVQVCGNGTTGPGITTCIPYLQGYGQFTYAFKGGSFAALGTQYFGKNNSYFSPPFAQVDFLLRRPVTKSFALQLSVQNLLNTNTYNSVGPVSGAGVPLVANTTNASYSQVLQTTYPITNLNPAPPRTFRIQGTLHI
jgi:outer membrane receptor protein involved in Fe transport